MGSRRRSARESVDCDRAPLLDAALPPDRLREPAGAILFATGCRASVVTVCAHQTSTTRGSSSQVSRAALPGEIRSEIRSARGRIGSTARARARVLANLVARVGQAASKLSQSAGRPRGDEARSERPGGDKVRRERSGAERGRRSTKFEVKVVETGRRSRIWGHAPRCSCD